MLFLMHLYRIPLWTGIVWKLMDSHHSTHLIVKTVKGRQGEEGSCLVELLWQMMQGINTWFDVGILSRHQGFVSRLVSNTNKDHHCPLNELNLKGVLYVVNEWSWHQAGILRVGVRNLARLQATFDPGLPKTTNIPSHSVPLMIKFGRRTFKD